MHKKNTDFICTRDIHKSYNLSRQHYLGFDALVLFWIFVGEITASIAFREMALQTEIGDCFAA